jgi:hypothetical protein
LPRILLGLALGMLVGMGLAYVWEVSERAKGGSVEGFGEFQEALKDAKTDFFGLRRFSRRASTSDKVGA